jgi:hypothetical protein
VRGRLVLVAVAALLLATGCGGHSKHKAVADYITRVDDVEQGMAGPLQQVTRVNRSFAKSQSNPKAEVELAKSEQTMRKLRVRLGKVTAPPEAAHLHALLLRLVDREVALTHETRQLATFVQRYQAVLRPMQAASTKLKTKLAEKAKGAAATKALDAEKADELDRYASAASGVIAKLKTLDPPPVWNPTWAAELSALEQLRTSALALAAGIRSNDAKAIPQLLEHFDAAAVSNQSTAAQKREIAAVKAYDARVKALVKLATAVQIERTRLQTKYK